MDPITQGALGAGLAQTAQPGEVTHRRWLAAGLGAMAGMAPDIDVLIQSRTDPLLFLEYHRQFTHALVFIPIGALICAALGYFLLRRQVDFKTCYLFCFLGYATHALLDACTSYGTQLFWPFSNVRIDWSNVSVVDPMFTIPLLIAVIVSARKGRRVFAYIGLAWAAGYLGLGVVQRERAEAVAAQLASDRGLVVQRLAVKPAFASLLLWRSIVEADGLYYVDGIRVGLESTIIAGSSAPKLDLATHFPTLDPNSQQALDVERFRWFSQDFLAVDPRLPQRIVDVRYSMLPNKIDGMWGVLVNPDAAPSDHIGYETMRDVSDRSLTQYWDMLRGDVTTYESVGED